ncbi:MAG: S-methyl-5-thioribose-1-phosphate isomerase [Candidatus Korarchaeota archaeon NZ13-K]|nr:MAG: S-methyl-5-thioribose-1-phosphate isomerase [Candidatus Korarchaeota archaeon NZ13-K]
MIDLPRTVEFDGRKVIMVDQRRLPEELTFFECESIECVSFAIRNMVVRGAPAIAAAAAFGLALHSTRIGVSDPEGFAREMRRAAELLGSTRPTAYNMFWALERMMRAIEGAGSVEEMRERILREAREIAEEDVRANMAIGEHGRGLIRDGCRIMTICNAGSLATVWLGTATAPLYLARSEGVRFEVYVLETRPLLQGARITAFELRRAGIPVKLIVDGAAGYVISELGVDLIITGADRVLSDGTVFNKIGTYTLSVLAKEHGVPFYVAAPTSTIDARSSREDVRIEMRDPEEVLVVNGRRIAPEGVEVLNPAFDVTPPGNLTGIITERGIVRRPFDEGIRRILSVPR